MPGTANPIRQITGLTTLADVSKEDFVAWGLARVPQVMANAAEVNASDLSGQLVIKLKSNGRDYVLDTSDTTTPDDGGVTCIRDFNGLAFIVDTGFPSPPYVVGDLPYASTTGIISMLAAVAVGAVLVSGGVGAPPAWSATPSLTSLALGGATIGTNKLAVTGNSIFTLTQDTTGSYSESRKDSSPANYGPTRAMEVWQFRDTGSNPSGTVFPGWVFQSTWSGDGVVSLPGTSTSVFAGVFHSVRKSGDGSAHGFTTTGNLDAVGAIGYNELSGFASELTNNASTNGYMAGAEYLLKDSPDAGATDFDTRMAGFVARIARYNAGSKLSYSFLASSEGTESLDAIVAVHSGGTKLFKNGIDLTNGIFSTGRVAVFPNNTNLTWYNSAAAAKPILYVDASDITTLGLANTTSVLKLVNSSQAATGWQVDATGNELATTFNKVTITTPAASATLTIDNGKTLRASATLTLTGTDGTTMTFPAASDTVAGLGTAQTFTKQNIFNIATTFASATAAALDDLKVSAATTTITGNTGSPITRLAKVGIYRPTLTDSSAVTVTDAASFYIDNSPLAAGSVTITNAWSILVGAGKIKSADTTTASSTTAASVVLAGGLAVNDNIRVLKEVRIGATSGLSADPGFYITSQFPKSWLIAASNSNGSIYWWDGSTFPFFLNTGAPNNSFYVNASGGVAFGATTDAGAGGLLVNGQIYGPNIATTASAANAFIDTGSTPAGKILRSTSSLRYKRDVEDLDPSLADKVLELRPVWYRSRAENDNQNWSWYGIIAEEAAAVDPRLVHFGYHEEDYEIIDTEQVIGLDHNGKEIAVNNPIRRLRAGAKLQPDAVQYDRLPVLLLSIIKRQDKRIAELEARAA